ncbi:hypothetical protein HZH68_015067 [Vespula germanica]|uniref:Uncharacterized protein n=1 Tax=Vespula germanica TaxID=30212 RepID=A0A834J798_VESGE|nr:hypothetical protein HZH68_015067 [Vespula germanica]
MTTMTTMTMTMTMTTVDVRSSTEDKFISLREYDRSTRIAGAGGTYRERNTTSTYEYNPVNVGWQRGVGKRCAPSMLPCSPSGPNSQCRPRKYENSVMNQPYSYLEETTTLANLSWLVLHLTPSSPPWLYPSNLFGKPNPLSLLFSLRRSFAKEEEDEEVERRVFVWEELEVECRGNAEREAKHVAARAASRAPQN